MGLLSRAGGNALLGGVLGGAAGMGASDPAAGGDGNYLGNMAMGAGAGAAGLGGLSAMKGLILKLAQAMKQQRPDLPDEVILQAATKAAQQSGQGAGGMMPPMGGGMPPGGM